MNNPRDPKEGSSRLSRAEMDQIVLNARKADQERQKGYREKSLKIHPWICARCGREFTNRNLHMLTVHHKDHNHENNPSDGSNWENLCIYCHDNEHSRELNSEYYDDLVPGEEEPDAKTTYKPFAALETLLKKSK